MSEDGSTVEERLAVRLIREFEDLVKVERLEPPGSDPIADWRVTTADGRKADVEVTWDTNQAGRRFESQLADEHVDESALRRRRSHKEWPDSRLSKVWSVRVYDHAPSSNRRPLKELVATLIGVLVDVEAAGGTRQEMLEAARRRLADPCEHFGRHDWLSARRASSASSADFYEFMLQWGRDTCYWYPQQLVDSFEAPPRRVHVVRVSEPDTPGSGVVRTSAVTPSPVFGEHEHMLSTVQHHIHRKTAKLQMEDALGLKWLFVVLDNNMAAGQLDDYFGPACQELEVSERCPYHVLGRLQFDYFDEVWITGRAFQDGSHIVLRLFESEDAPQHKVISHADVLAAGPPALRWWRTLELAS